MKKLRDESNNQAKSPTPRVVYQTDPDGEYYDFDEPSDAQINAKALELYPHIDPPSAITRDAARAYFRKGTQ